MLEKSFEFLIKKIVTSDEDEDVIEASNAMDFLVCHLDSLFLYSFFENKLNAKEKYRFFTCFSDAEEAAIISGNSLKFMHYRKIFKQKYIFIFKRAFKINAILQITPGLLLCIYFYFSNNLIFHFIIATSIALIAFFIYVKRRLHIAIKQNEIIIKEIKKEELSKNTKRMKSHLIEDGWLIQD